MEDTELGGSREAEVSSSEGTGDGGQLSEESGREDGIPSLRDEIKSTIAKLTKDKVDSESQEEKSSESEPQDADNSEDEDDDGSTQEADTDDDDSESASTQQNQPKKDVIAPATWNKAEKEAFYKAPPEVQAAVARRELETRRVLTQVWQEVNGFKAKYSDFEELVAPKLEMYESEGLKPAQIVQNALEWDQAFRSNKYQAAADFLKAYGVDINEIAQIQAELPEEPQIDNTTLELQQRVQQLEQMLVQQHQQQQLAQQQAVRGSLQQEIDRFRNAKDSAGNYKYPYAEQLEEVMESYMPGVMKRYPGQPVGFWLEKAYKLAQADDETLSIRASQQRLKSQISEASQRVERAKKAASVGLKSDLSGDAVSTDIPTDSRSSILYTIKQLKGQI